MELQNYLETIVKPLVSFPEDVSVEQTQDNMGILLTLHLNPADMGKIIGREGQTAKAVRYLIKCFGAMQKAHVAMKIYEPQRENRPKAYERRPFDNRSEDDFNL